MPNQAQQQTPPHRLFLTLSALGAGLLSWVVRRLGVPVPIIPGDSRKSMEPDLLWRLYERGVLTESEIVLAFLDYLGDDVEPVVSALPAGFREIVEQFLRSKSIDEIREGIHIGPGLPAEDRVRWRQYRQRKAEAIACHLGIRKQAADA